MAELNNIPYVTLRIKFKKTGRLQYISHLDLVRTMHKILVRTKLPMWYTEGFNPKPKMVFAAPLSIGAESVCEFMDIRLTERISPDNAIRILNQNMTSDMQVTEAYYPTEKFTDLKWFSYTIKIKSEQNAVDLAQKCNELFAKTEINVLKKTKSGEQTVNIKPLIHSASAVPDGELCKLNLILSADQSCFLNPEHVVTAIKNHANILTEDKITSEYYTVMRERAYRADMSEFK